MAVGSFSAGLSGLNANAVYLSVIGNNLANINTVGYKASTVTFMDLVSQSAAGSSINPMQVGLGVVTGSISPVFSQGSIESTREATNVAIEGNGFFIVSDGQAVSYTRAGNFSFDASGNLVTPDGLRVQGWTQIGPDGEPVTTGAPTDITVPPGVLRAPVATSTFFTKTNLSASALVGDTFTSSVELIDSLGARHLSTVTFTKTAAGEWSFSITVDGGEVTGGTAGVPYELAAGSVVFDANGLLTSITPTAPATGGGALPGDPDMDVSFTTPAWTNGAAASTLTWDLTDDNGTAALTGFDAPSATLSLDQNGSMAGTVDGITILPDGRIQASVGAGQSVNLGQIALAMFNNPKGLEKLGGNRYGETQSSGLPNVGVAGTGGRGTLFGSALEASNVDIAQEFTQMILAQRGYQANSKTITVSDELLVETLNLKR
ncbi:MAG TPA: flagellar hook protein FlgE [Vicinamibacterales bacterium]